MTAIRACLAATLAAGLLAGLPAGEVNSILELTGGRRTRIVWASGSSTDQMQLKGLDTENGGTPRAILPTLGKYNRQFITPSGNQIVYNVGKGFSGGVSYCDVWACNWDGSNNRLLKADAATPFVWRDENTGKEWVYYTSNVGDARKPVRRFRHA